MGNISLPSNFYEDAYKTVIKFVDGKLYILSAAMHADERNCAMFKALKKDRFHHHLHMIYVPVVDKQFLWSKRFKDKLLMGTVKETSVQMSIEK